MKLHITLALISIVFLSHMLSFGAYTEDRISVIKATDYQRRLEKILNTNIIPFWFSNSIDEEYGGFILDQDLEGRHKDGSANKMIVTQARMVWYFSRLVSTGRDTEVNLPVARQGYDFLKNRMWDKTNGGFYWKTDRSGNAVIDANKHLYGQAFALYAISEYAIASKDDEALKLADRLFTLLEDHAHDRLNGGYAEVFLPDWSPAPEHVRGEGPLDVPNSFKLMNTHLHLMEAMTAYYRVSGNHLARERLLELIQIQSNAIVRKNIGGCTDKYAPDWTPIISDGYDRVSYGHDIENVWLLADACKAVNLSNAPLLDLYRTLFNYSTQYGFDHKHGGFYQSGPFNKPADQVSKAWWVQAEGLVSALSMFGLTRDAKYLNYFEKTLDWIEKHQVDWNKGEWFWIIGSDNRPSGDKANEWKGAYHTGRAIMECLDIVKRMRAPSVSPAQIIGCINTSKWCGFNLRNKFTLGPNASFESPEPYHEEDFRWMAEWGFNFARLPLDYRCYTLPDNPLAFEEANLKEIDEAIEFGRKYNIHVCINLHRAPGYRVGLGDGDEETGNLWTNERAFDIFVAHWKMFASRYKDVPHTCLSFNLINEPRTTKENFLKVHLRTIEAIHQIDPKRIIVIDGLDTASKPLQELLNIPNVIQATRGYTPGTISHYKKPGSGTDYWPKPVWPSSSFITGRLYGPQKSELAGPFLLRSDFREGTVITIRVHQVSLKAAIIVRADGATIWKKTFEPKDGEGEWKKVIYAKSWNRYQNIYDQEYTFTLPSSAKEVSFENTDGDWLMFSEFSIRQPGGEKTVFTTDIASGKKPGSYEIGVDGEIAKPPDFDPEWQLSEYLGPWVDIAAQGETVFVGEWGAFNRTPHYVTLAWMRSWLEKWKEAGFGWALWNFSGPFGILDSEREDVEYEDFHGHKLDRKMLELLQEYMAK